MSSFSGLSTALTGLYAARRGLDTAGQNIANANTDGYSRQRLELVSVGAPAVPAVWSTYAGAGSGVDVAAVQRMGDAFLTARARAEQDTLGRLAQQQQTLAGVEGAFSEPGETGLSAQLADLWSSWHDVANRPGDLAARAQLLSRTSTLADGIRQAYSSMDAQWAIGREQLGSTVVAVNNTADAVAELNQAILRDTQAGIPANELMDSRDLLVTKLASLVGAHARPGADGSLDVFVGGTALVRGSTSAHLAATGAARMDDFRTGASPAVSLVWAATGYPAEPGGEVGARVEALAGTIPSYADALDAVVVNLRDAVNAAHAGGYDLDGAAGGNLFDPAATAKDIAGLLDDPRKVAASGEAPNPGPSLDGSNAAALADLEIATGGPDAAYRQMIVALGASAQTANRRVDIQTNVAGAAEAAREAQAGVNVDEEMISLLSFQRAYEAAARVISAVDSALDTLINRTGLVGR
jgi:flagellar hook-associated protein 1 FlgK